MLLLSGKRGHISCSIAWKCLFLLSVSHLQIFQSAARIKINLRLLERGNPSEGWPVKRGKPPGNGEGSLCEASGSNISKRERSKKGAMQIISISFLLFSIYVTGWSDSLEAFSPAKSVPFDSLRLPFASRVGYLIQ